jgi:pimeloyl-ACP methyl ester carboxylesterase
MPHVSSIDGVRLYYEEVGSGTPIVFVHEFGGDHRSWEPQLRAFARSHRCIAFAARGYPPSDVPESGDRYGQDIAVEDVTAILDELGVGAAHVVGHSMGAYTALHFGIRQSSRCLSVAVLGCGWGSDPTARDAAAATCVEIAQMFEAGPPAQAAANYARAPMRHTFEAKDPRSFAEFERMLAEHSGLGSALTMLNLQLKRPTLWEMGEALRGFVPPLLVIVGDEDFPCLDGSLFLKRTVPTAGLLVMPRTGHTINSEEPSAVNGALAEFFAASEAGSWLSHRRPRAT